MTEIEIKKAWLRHGGNFYGPITETASIPESGLFIFARELTKNQEELLNALICMTGWVKECAKNNSWTHDNAALIFAGIKNADMVMDKIMGGKKPPRYFMRSNA